MYKRYSLIAAILLFIGVGTWAVTRSMTTNSPQSVTNNATVEMLDNIQTGKVSQAGGGAYRDYQEGVLADTQGTKILFFHATWCSQCRALEADIQENGLPAGTTVFKVDYDNAQDLRRKYGVTLQTTVVKVDEGGNQLAKYVPYSNPTLESVLANL